MVRALAASFCLFALTAVPTVSGAAAGGQLTNSEQRTLSVAQESIQLAQSGRVAKHSGKLIIASQFGTVAVNPASAREHNGVRRDHSLLRV
jgi:hypothetical protein